MSIEGGTSVTIKRVARLRGRPGRRRPIGVASKKTSDYQAKIWDLDAAWPWAPLLCRQRQLCNHRRYDSATVRGARAAHRLHPHASELDHFLTGGDLKANDPEAMKVAKSKCLAMRSPLRSYSRGC